MAGPPIAPLQQQRFALRLRTVLGLAFGASALLMAFFVSLVVGSLAGNQVRSRVVGEFRILASEMRDKVDRALFERLSDIKLLTNAPVMMSRETPPARRRDRMEDFREASPDHAWIGFADPSGRLVASTGGILEGTDVSHWPWFQGGLNGPFVSDSGQAITGEHPTIIDMAAPVYASDTTLIGVVVSNLSWTWAEEMSRETVANSNEAVDILIVSQSGRVLLGPGRGGRLELPKILLSSSDGLSTADTGDQLIAVAPSRGYRDYPNLGWRVVVREDAQKAIRPVRELQQRVRLWGSGIGLLFVLLGMFMAKTITRPLRAIEAAADRLRSGGTSNLEIPQSTFFREIEVLSRSLIELFEQRESARRAAEAAGNARADFLAAMSHEIRTPMTGVLGMADLLAAEDLTRKQKSYVEVIRTQGRHLLNIINDILDFSRIETGKLEFEHINFSMASLLERVRSLVHPLAVERGLDLHFDLAAHSPPVLKGDPTRLKQVILNLVGNALKFTARGHVSITVSVQSIDERRALFRFEVRDTGIGIAPEKQGDLFTAFTQADRSTVRQYGGSGLGLAISKRLVEAMGGEIGVNSAVGLGSVFWFELPLELGDVVDVEEAGSFQFTRAQPRRILIAEDVKINQEILEDALSRQGHHVMFADNGAEALALVQREQFDLILMDVQMPVMDGVEATRRIRKLDGPARDIPIIGLTANVMAQEITRYLAAGMNECLMKPMDWQQLSAAIERYGGEGTAEQVLCPEEEGQEDNQDAPLVQRALLDKLGDKAVRLVIRTLESAERSCEQMATLPVGSKELEREAHNLRGTAGFVGLKRISRVAGEIEGAARIRHDPTELLNRLKEVIAATRAELHRLGIG